MDIKHQTLKSQTTESLKALLDFSVNHKNSVYKNIELSVQLTAQFDSDALKMYNNYSEIVKVLEDELGSRLEDIFIF